MKLNPIWLAVAASLASYAAPTLAQQTGQQLERVEVTGSSIRRIDAETSSPVQIISKEDIAQSGKGTVAEYLQTLTADGQGSVPFTYGRGFSGATSSGISLRGLGANATLVLINGRRVTTAVLADDAQRSYTDLNQIPMEAVERVEVLKDGASSTYGSDAVAGVVNIILKKNFTGSVAKVSYGMSQKRDGKEPRVALTHGFGDLSKDGYNVLLNAELGQKQPIYYRDRMGRGSVGVSAIGQAPWGFDPNSSSSNNIPRLGGQGWIPVGVNNSATQSIIGNVRNPTTLDYYSRGDAAGVGFAGTYTSAAAASAYCASHVNLTQNNPRGGCILDQRQMVNQIQPEQRTVNFYSRLTKAFSAETEGFVELGYYHTASHVDGLAPNPGGAYFTPDGISHSQAADTVLGATHPDNPYQGTAARLSYLPLFDTGIGGTDSKSHTMRGSAGLKGTFAGWDYDTAVSYSEARQTDTLLKVIDWRVKNALLNPTAANVALATAFNSNYAALPAGTVWRIGEKANLNSQAMYNALLANKSREGYSQQYGGDFKVSREFGELPGGPIGVALGLEARHEAYNLPFYNGLGNYIGLALTSYGSKRDLYATYGEILAPVTKQIELNAAVRYDNYSDAGSSTTPKIGIKFKPLSNFALRSTYSQGFRAPSSSENGAQSIAAFSGTTVTDTARCTALLADGLSQATADANCKNVAPAFVQRGNPNLKPEKSKSYTLGLVWDVMSSLSLTTDFWQIKRTGMPVLENTQSAVNAGRIVRDPATKISANDPGAILNGFVVFQNSSSSETSGVDVEVKNRFNLGAGMGKLSNSLTWTHLTRQRVTDADGTVHDYAGTHGNCDITNCIGSPKDRLSLASTWDMGQWRLGVNVNYRGAMDNTLEKGEPCAQSVLGGAPFPSGCKVKSFTTTDLSGAYKLNKNIEFSASIANLFDRVPPPDFLTYGAIGYNPLDYSGGIGRYYRVTMRAAF